MSQLQEIMQSGSSQSNRMPQMRQSRGKTVFCYGGQQTGHYLRECPQKITRPFNRYTRQNASTNKVDEPQQRESKPIKLEKAVSGGHREACSMNMGHKNNDNLKEDNVIKSIRASRKLPDGVYLRRSNQGYPPRFTTDMGA